MRKRYKIKLRSCGLCKPQKQGWAHRFTPQQEAALKDFEVMKRLLESVNQPTDARTANIY